MEYFTKRYQRPGTPPGALIADDSGAPASLRMTLVEYDADTFMERDDCTMEECSAEIKTPTHTWIHVQGQPTPEVLREIGAAFGLHPLALEDVLNSGQRPKAEAYDRQLFIVMSLPHWREPAVHTEQISLFFGTGFLVSFCNGAQDPFEPVRQRLRKQGTALRGHGPDFLLYSLMDLVIDQGFPVLENLGEHIEDLEEALLEHSGNGIVGRIHHLRRELLLLRRMLWPQREVLNTLMRDGHQLISSGTHLYLRDCYDHTIQIMDLLETYRDSMAALMDVYLSGVSNRLNETIRVLTIIATIFIPPTFVVGVYGMNFNNPASPWAMPELHWYYGYPMVWAVIVAMIGGMLWWFRRKGWW